MARGNQPSELLDRVPPSDVAMEKRVIGMMILKYETVPVVKSILSPKDFHNQTGAARWYSAILGLYEETGGVDVSLLVTWVRENEGNDVLYKEMGGTAYLAEAMNTAGLATLAKHYCKVLKDHATRRRVIGLACKILTAAYGAEIPVSELLERTRKAVEYLGRDENAEREK